MHIITINFLIDVYPEFTDRKIGSLEYTLIFFVQNNIAHLLMLQFLFLNFISFYCTLLNLYVELYPIRVFKSFFVLPLLLFNTSLI